MSTSKAKSRSRPDKPVDADPSPSKRSVPRGERSPTQKKRKMDNENEFEHLQPKPKKALPLSSSTESSLPLAIHSTSPTKKPSSSSSQIPKSSSSKPILIDLDDDASMDVTDADDWVRTTSTASQTNIVPTFGRNINTDLPSQQLVSSSQSSSSSPSLRSSRTLSTSQISPVSRLDSLPTLGQSRLEEQRRTNSTKKPTVASVQMSSYLAPASSHAPPSPQLSSSTTSSLPWCQKYAPKTVAQLAIHPTKLNSLVELLSSMIRACQLNRSHIYSQTIPGTRVLILTGPTGTAKSTAINLLLGQGLINDVLPLERFDVDLLEYHTPVQYSNVSLDELDFGPGQDMKNPFEVHSRPTWSITYESKLKPFLQQLQVQKYPSLSISGVDPMMASLHISDRSSSSTMSTPGDTPANRIKVLLVDDMPYLHDWRQKTDFQNAIKSILNARDYNPIIFVLSHAQSSDTSTPWQLFTRDILEHPSVKLLEFNPVNSMLIRKTLTSILKEEKLSLPKKDLDALVESCSGDIRSAVNSLEWLAEKQTNPVVSSSSSRSKSTDINSDYTQMEMMKKSSTSKSGSTTTQDEYTRVKVIPALMRDVSLSLFHSLGKIMYVKRLREGDIDDAGNVVYELAAHETIPKSSPLYRMPLKASPETIHASNVGHDNAGGLLMHYMHENYIKFFGSLEDAASAIDYLAAADIFSSGPFRENALLSEYSDLIAMRGILYSNNHPKERTFTKLLKPQSLLAFRTMRDNSELLDLIYLTPNMDMETKQSGSHVKFARNGDSNKVGIVTEVIGRGELIPHQTSFLSKSQIVCDVMPYQGTIMREAAKSRFSTRYSGILRPAEKSFVDVMCRFSATSSGSGSGSGGGSFGNSILSEQASSADSEEFESVVKERDRKQIIMSNILKERRVPPSLGGLAPATRGFNSGSTSISSTYARPQPHSDTIAPSHQYPSSSSSSSSHSMQTGFRFGRFGGAASSSMNPITISSQPSSQSTSQTSSSGIQVIEIEDDIMDDGTWTVKR